MSSLDSSWRRTNIGSLLFTASTCFLDDKWAFMGERGYTSLSEPQLSLFVNIEAAGTGITALAARAGVTKQSIVELVNKAEKAGHVVRIKDPADKRVRRVELTEQGFQVQHDLQLAIRWAEERFAQCLGTEFTGEFKKRWGRSSRLPNDAIDAGWAGGEADIAWRTANVGRVLALSSRSFAATALETVQQQGYPELSPVTLTLLRNLELNGSRLTALAEAARITKQSMRELVDNAEALDLVERTSDESDRRAKLIRFSRKGLAFLEDMREAITVTEARAAEQVGAAFLAETRTRLRTYIDHRSRPQR